MINDWAGEARQGYFEYLDGLGPEWHVSGRRRLLAAIFGITPEEATAIEDDWEIKRHEKKLAADAGLKGPITLNTEDWVEVYAALESKRHHVKMGGDDARWINHLTRIMDVIGPDGENAAKYGCTKADGTR
jgi:hypothetical protein